MRKISPICLPNHVTNEAGLMCGYTETIVKLDATYGINNVTAQRIYGMCAQYSLRALSLSIAMLAALWYDTTPGTADMTDEQLMRALTQTPMTSPHIAADTLEEYLTVFRASLSGDDVARLCMEGLGRQEYLDKRGVHHTLHFHNSYWLAEIKAAIVLLRDDTFASGRFIAELLACECQRMLEGQRV